MKKEEKKAGIFEGQDPEDYGSVERMTQQIRDLGGMLHFTISKSEDGWMAKCNEFDGIITGGLNSEPTDFEVESQIREAIHTAFDVKTKMPPEKLRSSVSELSLSVC